MGCIGLRYASWALLRTSSYMATPIMFWAMTTGLDRSSVSGCSELLDAAEWQGLIVNSPRDRVDLACTQLYVSKTAHRPSKGHGSAGGATHHSRSRPGRHHSQLSALRRGRRVSRVPMPAERRSSRDASSEVDRSLPEPSWMLQQVDRSSGRAWKKQLTQDAQAKAATGRWRETAVQMAAV